MAKAMCSLDSVSRWAVTGTPIQNRLADLASLLRFIRAHPYNDTRQFDTDISCLWKSGEDDEAVKRLKRLSACLILRRPKSTIQLPERWDRQCPVEFTSAERAVYDAMRTQAISKIDDALNNDSEVSRSSSYANILQQIESMRLFCNLGLRYETRHAAISASSSSISDTDWAVRAQRIFNAQRGMGPIMCLLCGSELDLAETLLGGAGGGPQHNAYFTRCSRFVCADCVHRETRHGQVSVACGHNPSCPAASVSLSDNAMEEVEEDAFLSEGSGTIGLSSKVNALVADLKALPLDVKWFERLESNICRRMPLTFLR